MKKSAWKCTSCKNRSKSASSQGDLEEDSQRKLQATTTVTKEQLIDNNKTKETNELKVEINKLSNIISLLNDNIVKLSQKITNTEDNMSKLNDIITELHDENKIKDKRIDELELKINNIAQKALPNNVEIVNGHIPHMCPKYNILQLARASDITITSSDVVDAYSLKSKNKLIVNFSSLCIKKHFMKRVRERVS